MTSGKRTQVALRGDVLQWARQRVGLQPDQLARKIGVDPASVESWERTGLISLAQVARLAQHTYTPLGYLFLPEPPAESLPIPDFRTRGDAPPRQPSPDLLDTIRIMQRRQAWMREELIQDGATPLAFVGALQIGMHPRQAADVLRSALGIGHDWANRTSSWTDALRKLRDRVEAAGVLVFSNGIVGNNTRRKLDIDEFRGFTLVDEYAPLIFVNSADFKAAQLFTLAHETVHVLVGTSGISGDTIFPYLPETLHKTELFCNQVAAEFLVPADDLVAFWAILDRMLDPFEQVARRFRVSTLVAARRALDLGLIDRTRFFDFYTTTYGTSLRGETQPSQDTGGSFWNNQMVRVGQRFGCAVVRAVREGRLLYREAYALTGLRGKTFDSFAARLERLSDEQFR